MAGTRQTKEGSLTDLIDAKLLTVGEELQCRPPRRIGGKRKAYLQSDGSVKDRDSGEVYSLAAWSNLVKDSSSNAWISVTARDEKLDYFREQLNRTTENQSDVGDRSVSVYSPQSSGASTSQPEVSVRAKPTEPSVASSEIGGLLVEVESLKSWVADLNAKVNSLPPSLPENHTEYDITEKLRERLLILSPDEFERLVGEYLRAKGFANVEVTQYSHDGGIDGHCEIPFVGVKAAFQAKRYTSNNVGIDPVQRLQGSITGRYDRGIFITTSDFTLGAREYVENPTVRITLVNGERLLNDLLELGLGVKAVSVVMHELDDDFFADL